MNEDTYRDKLTDLQLEVEELRAKLKEAQTGDLISRRTLNDMLTMIPIRGMKREDDNLHALVSLAQVFNVIEQLPSAQPLVLTCDGCRHVGTYDTDFPCSGCIRREKDYYEQER